MNAVPLSNLMSTVEAITTSLDTHPDSWRDQVQTVRNTTTCVDLLDASPAEFSFHMQTMVISVFQRIAFIEADTGIIQDIADWCLRQSLNLLDVFPNQPVLLSLIGRNWLSRTQRSLANISRLELASSSSSAASTSASATIHQMKARRAYAETQAGLQTADYVEARGTLVPATDYLQRAVNAAREAGGLDGTLLCTAAESYMSLGNVTSSRLNSQYFAQAIAYLQEAADMQDYTLSEHLEQYLEEYGPLY